MLRHCGSIETISSYQRISKHRDSPDRTGEYVRKSNRRDTNLRRPVEGLGRYFSESPDAPKLMGMSSKTNVPRQEEPSSSPQRKVSILGLFVRYEELGPFSATPTAGEPRKELFAASKSVHRSPAYSPSTKKSVAQRQLF